MNKSDKASALRGGEALEQTSLMGEMGKLSEECISAS